MDATANAPANDQAPPKKGSDTKLLLLMIIGGLVVLFLVIPYISALLYLGVFNSGTRIPDLCDFPKSISCTSASVTSHTTTLSLRNNFGEPIRICNMVCDNVLDENSVSLGGADGACTNTLATLPQDGSVTVTVNTGCKDATGTIPAGGRYRGKIFVTFLSPSDSGNPRVSQGIMQILVK
ncbi:MAG: hypothetical protein Q7T16_02275 [Candidatus Burarchaeum sp.]|nr:hypothetical protein [Candidatus Burarchaeum sp.]MDO8339460.1 hypothetical protein [Candidatus Burarchaeum sp.]